MSDAYDRALAALDGNETQRSVGGVYDGEWIPAGCVRCSGQVEGDGALCSGCRAFLACETDDDPTESGARVLSTRPGQNYRSDLALRCGLGGAGGIPYRGPLPPDPFFEQFSRVETVGVAVMVPEGCYEQVESVEIEMEEER